MCGVLFFGVSHKTIIQTVKIWKKKNEERNAGRINLHPLIGKSKANPRLEFVFVFFGFPTR